MRAPAISTASSSLLDLRKDVFVQSSTGYEAKLSQAYVDINQGTVISDERSTSNCWNGTLTADRLRILNSGELVRFEGNVVMNLIMDNPPAPEPEPPPPPPKTRSVSKPANRNDLMMKLSSRRFAQVAFALALLAAGGACAQGAVSGVPNAMQGFSQNRDQADPDRSGATRDARQEKEATFSGNVKSCRATPP